jgi:hypothetical protein
MLSQYASGYGWKKVQCQTRYIARLRVNCNNSEKMYNKNNMKSHVPRDWDAVRGDLDASEAFLEVPGIIDGLKITLPEGLASSDIVAAAAAQSRRRLSYIKAAEAEAILHDKDGRLPGLAGQTAADLYEKGQRQASLAYDIMRVTGVSSEFVAEMPISVRWSLIPQIDMLEQALWSNGLVD